MLSETIAHLTRKIAEELDTLSGRDDRSTATDHTPSTEGPESSLALVEEPLHEAQAPADSAPAAQAPAAQTPADPDPASEEEDAASASARSLREVLSWRRLKIN